MEVLSRASASKERLRRADVLKLLGEVQEVYAAKGKKVTYVDLRKGKPDREALLGLLLGPTGNLRAPALRKGRTLIVGFNEEMYGKVFC